MMPSINDFQSFSGEMKVVGESVCNAENWIPLNEGLLEYRGLLHAKPQLLNTNISDSLHFLIKKELGNAFLSPTVSQYLSIIF